MGLYAHSVSVSSPAHPSIPSHVHILSTMGLVMVIQGPLAPLLSSSCYIFCDSCICSMVLPLSWLRNHSKLGVSGLRFVNARFPYLFYVTFLCVLRSCSVLVHICMSVIHILPSPSFLLLVTSQLVDVTWCVIFIIQKIEMLMPNYFAIKRLINSTPTVGYRLQVAPYIHYSGKLTLPLSLPPSISPNPSPPPLLHLVLEDTDVTRCR